MRKNKCIKCKATRNCNGKLTWRLKCSSDCTSAPPKEGAIFMTICSCRSSTGTPNCLSSGNTVDQMMLILRSLLSHVIYACILATHTNADEHFNRRKSASWQSIGIRKLTPWCLPRREIEKGFVRKHSKTSSDPAITPTVIDNASTSHQQKKDWE